MYHPEKALSQSAARTSQFARLVYSASRKALAELTADVDLVHTALNDFQSIASMFHEDSHARYYELVNVLIALLRKLGKQISLAWVP